MDEEQNYIDFAHLKQYHEKLKPSLKKAESALQSESDPTVPSHVKSITEQNISDWSSTRPTYEVTSKTIDDIGGEGTIYTIDKVNIMPITPAIRASDEIIFGTQNSTYWATVTQVNTDNIKARVDFSGATIDYVNQQIISGGEDTVKYTEQSLNSAQQAQARTNIDAASNGDLQKVINNKTLIGNSAGGFAAGRNAKTETTSSDVEGFGVAIGQEAKSQNGGIALGAQTTASAGGVALGGSSMAVYGAAVGSGAESGRGFSGGMSAKVKNNGSVESPNYIDAIQLGRGTNETPLSLQVYDKNIYKSDEDMLTVQNIELNGKSLIYDTWHPLSLSYEPTASDTYIYLEDILGADYVMGAVYEFYITARIYCQDSNSFWLWSDVMANPTQSPVHTSSYSRFAGSQYTIPASTSIGFTVNSIAGSYSGYVDIVGYRRIY